MHWVDSIRTERVVTDCKDTIITSEVKESGKAQVDCMNNTIDYWVAFHCGVEEWGRRGGERENEREKGRERRGGEEGGEEEEGGRGGKRGREKKKGVCQYYWMKTYYVHTHTEVPPQPTIY